MVLSMTSGFIKRSWLMKLRSYSASIIPYMGYFGIVFRVMLMC